MALINTPRPTLVSLILYCCPRNSRSVANTLALVIIQAIAFTVKAQTCSSTTPSAIATDRPQFTNSSVVVPCGSLQFENGFAVTAAGGQRSLDFPETSIRFGITSTTELRLAAPDYIWNVSGASAANGFTDLSLGLKQQLRSIAGFSISLIPSLSLPTGSHALSSHGYDPNVQLPWSRSLTKAWTIAGQLAVAWPTESGRRNATGQTSIYFDRQLTTPLDAYIEYSGAFAQRGGPQHIIDFGAAYKPTPHQQIDLHCGFGLSSDAPGYFIGLGYSFLIPAIGFH